MSQNSIETASLLQKILRSSVKDKRRLIFRAILFVVLFAVSLLIFSFINSHLVFVGMKSVRPYVLFWKTDSRDFTNGDFVVVRGKNTDRFTKGLLLTKKIGCKEGDVLVSIIYSNNTGSFYCCRNKNNISSDPDLSECLFLGYTKPFSEKYKVKLFPYNPCLNDVTRNFSRANYINATLKCLTIIPRDMYFLYTDMRDSYDSKYLGFFKKDEILYKLKPVF
jgi:hypothetical protein